MKYSPTGFFVLVAILMTLWTRSSYAQEADNACTDSTAEEIRQALKISYESNQQNRRLIQCVAQKWSDEYSLGTNRWILGILEQVKTKEGAKIVFQLIVVKKEKKTFRFVSSSYRFQINWFREPHWGQRFISIDTSWDPMGFPVFGITVRANFNYKMESHWHEKFVLFKMADFVVPVFSTTAAICDCRESDEMYPVECFEDSICPGKFLFADISYSKGTAKESMGKIVKIPKSGGRPLFFEFRPYTEQGFMEWSADPISQPMPLDVINSEY